MSDIEEMVDYEEIEEVRDGFGGGGSGRLSFSSVEGITAAKQNYISDNKAGIFALGVLEA